MQKGDTVRFLNAVGGGVIARIDGQIAYVTDEDGFDTPVAVKELVVVLPAGHDKELYAGGAKLMFDQRAADAVKARDYKERHAADLTKDTTPQPEPTPAIPVEETDHGEKISISLAFEPSDIKRLQDSSFAAVLVNDSNYYLSFVFLRRDDSDKAWTVVYRGEVEPNMVVDLANFAHSDLPGLSRLALQCVAYKQDKSFELKAPVNVELRLDTTKFYKLHCFRPGIYFDTPVLEIPILTADKQGASVRNATRTPEDNAAKHDNAIKELNAKFNADRPARRRGEGKRPEQNPHKLLPLQEIDLHIGELVDTTAGMDNAAMLDLQLSTAKEVMRKHEKRIGQKIVFIHGKGDGVLRDKLRSMLRRDYPKAELQDASFREYGFGATLVTIH